ncbi:MAG: ParB/RepB/Spo0J family partition protein [Elainellaceae cyanobacterium]
MTKKTSFTNLIGTARSEETSGTASLVQLDRIKDRASDTRELNELHVEDLTASIAAVGLIEPLVLDKDQTLLAGGHRKAAIARLRDSDATTYKKHFGSGVPVHILDFSAADEPDRALAVEVAENTERRDYTAKEVKAIAHQLRESGYSDSEGRPKPGEKRLRPALQLITGKSERTLRRYLNESESETRPNDRVNPDTHLDRAIAALRRWEKDTGNDASKLIRSIEKQKSD